MAGDEGGFSGIDPDQLARTIQSLQKDQEKLRSSATWIKSSFERYGVETDPLTELLAIAGWSENQLPMLRRRHHLSIAEDEKYGHGYKGMVRIKESMVGQTKQSVANGKKLGDDLRKLLENGGDISPEMFADLRANKADADYLKAFYEALGPRQMAWMSNEMGDRFNDQYKEHPERREQDRKIIAETFATFTMVAFEGKSPTAKQQAWSKWFDDYAGTSEQGFRPDWLTPFLKGGEQDKDFLVGFGDRVFAKGKNGNEEQWMGQGLGEGEWGKDQYAQLFEAVSRNPAASGEWMDHNSEAVQSMLYPMGPWKVDEPESRGVAFLDVLNAGTVTLRKENPSLADKNAARLIYENYEHRKGELKGIRPIEGTAGLYANIITSYWEDLEYSVTSPAGNGLWSGGKKWDLQNFMSGQDRKRYGLEISQDLWAELMVEAGRHPQGAGVLGALFQGYSGKMMDMETDIDRDATSSDSMRYLSARKGLMQNFYYENMRTVTGEMDKEVEQWVKDTNAFRDGLIDKVTGVGLGGAGGAGVAGMKGAAIGAAYATGADILTGWVKKEFQVTAADAPQALRKQIHDVKAKVIDTSWQGSYQDQANSLLRDGYNKNMIPDVTEQHMDGTQRTHTGDPKSYIKGDSSRNFLTKDGSVMKAEDMSPTQRTAYSAWLQDPAVVHRVYEPFADGRNARDWPGQDE
ncbi:hypothetical protein OG288_24530 [Streptomyces tauricus]|uniref:Uncharacterized protein n=1 Tax=Streptomyces tauricus TaxID=68274 RepID=A0ABZ1JN39_9ACTN|nr:hypothetical protein [Streptomyces tauricus]